MKPEAKLPILIFYILLFGVLIFLTAYIFQASLAKGTEIYFFDIGQGDSSLIITPDLKYILIDGGPDNNIIYKLGQHLPFFQKKIDLIILTHPHDDHLLGLLEVMSRYEIGMVLMPKAQCQTAGCQQLEKILEQKNIPVQFVDHQGILNISPNLDFKILMPKEFVVTEKNLNNYSIVFQMINGGVKLLFVGDQENEEELIGNDIKSDIIKVGHHGSQNANDCDFLKDVDPIYAIISVGKDNKFNHPSQTTIDCLGFIGSKIIRTDSDGDIKFLIENGILAQVR